MSYISFEEYSADMRELSTSAAGSVRVLREKLEARDRAIIWLLRSAGGEIAVPLDIMADLGKWEIEVWEDKNANTRTFSASASPPEP